MPLTSKSALAFMILFTFILIADKQQAYGQYSVTDLSALNLPAGYNIFSANDINNSGQIVGHLYRTDTGQTHAARYANGVMTDLGTLPGYETSYASAINVLGQIVGSAYKSDGTSHLFIYKNGVMTDLGNFGYVRADAMGINNSGQIIGIVTNTTTHAFIYSDGVFTILPTPGVNSFAAAINDSGQVVGNMVVFTDQSQGISQKYAFIYSGGVLTQIPSLPYLGGQITCDANGINNQGVVVGECGTDSPFGDTTHAFIYSNGTTTDLGVINGISGIPGTGFRAADSYASRINDLGQIVGGGDGFNVYPNGFVERIRRGFLFYNATIKDITTLTPPSFGYKIVGGSRITNSGYILAVGRRDDWSCCEPFRPFLLSPATDSTPPQINTSDGTFAATSTAGAVVYYGGASVSDDYDRNPTVTYSQAPGTLFPIGTTVLTVTARDASGNTALSNFHITVVDTPPELSLPGDLVTSATSATGAAVTYFASANDVISGPEPVQCSPASGSNFPIGTNTVNCSATDGAGNIATGSFNVYVLTADQLYTPADGYSVTLQPASGPTLTFYYVSGVGVTTVTPIDAASIGTTPAGFALSNGIAYQISTTATFEDVVQLDFAVPGPISEADFNNLSILHNDNGNLVDVTGGRSYDSQSHAGTITAFTYSFSPFYLVKKVPLRIAPLYDQTKAFKAGSTVPVKLQLLNEAGANVSSAATALKARNLVRLGTSTTSAVMDAGNANPDLNFRYAGDSYIFNVKTSGLPPGSYALSFYVGNDRSFFYTVKFEVK